MPRLGLRLLRTFARTAYPNRVARRAHNGPKSRSKSLVSRRFAPFAKTFSEDFFFPFRPNDRSSVGPWRIVLTYVVRTPAPLRMPQIVASTRPSTASLHPLQCSSALQWNHRQRHSWACSGPLHVSGRVKAPNKQLNSRSFQPDTTQVGVRSNDLLFQACSEIGLQGAGHERPRVMPRKLARKEVNPLHSA